MSQLANWQIDSLSHYYYEVCIILTEIQGCLSADIGCYLSGAIGSWRPNCSGGRPMALLQGTTYGRDGRTDLSLSGGLAKRYRPYAYHRRGWHYPMGDDLYTALTDSYLGDQRRSFGLFGDHLGGGNRGYVCQSSQWAIYSREAQRASDHR